MRLKLLAAAFLPVGAVLLSTSDLFAQGGIPLQGNPFKEWNEKTIMIFSPHPDDDVIGCGGAPVLLSSPGNRPIVVCITNGGKGTLGSPLKATNQAKITRHEAAAASPAIRLAGAPLL